MTFNIPSQIAKALIGVGDHVKFGFVLPEPKGNVTIERMWVEVTCVMDETISGTIVNDPQFLDAKLGDRVTGERRHVLAILGRARRTLQ